MNNIKKLNDTNLAEDEIKNYQDDLQKLTDSFILNITEISKKKENEILQI